MGIIRYIMNKKLKKEVEWLEKRYIGKSIDKWGWSEWDSICVYCNLSENFMRKFKNKLHWECISSFQRFSLDFVLEFKR